MTSSVMPRTIGSSRLNHEIVRGVLIFVVILDHNDVIRNVRAVQDWFLPMTFHVAGFLILPFLSTSRCLNFGLIRDHLVRYLVPFAFALLGYAMIYRVVVEPTEPLALWLVNLFDAMLFADPWKLKVATGFIVLWFLPALFQVFLLTRIYDTVPVTWKATILLLSIIVSLGVGSVPVLVKSEVPQGLLVALMIFPLGLVARHSLPWLTARRRLWCAPVALGVLLACWFLEKGIEIEVATLVLPTAQHPLWVIATALSDLSFMVLIMAAAPLLALVPGLALLGRYSLLVYLLHPLLDKPIIGLMLRVCRLDVLGTPIGDLIYWGGAAASVLAVSIISVTAAATISACRPLRDLLTPRNWAEWLPIRVCSAMKSRYA